MTASGSLFQALHSDPGRVEDSCPGLAKPRRQGREARGELFHMAAEIGRALGMFHGALDRPADLVPVGLRLRRLFLRILQGTLQLARVRRVQPREQVPERGEFRVVRDGAVLWQREFLSGEANMSHTIANLEAHHFKYPLFRRPGDVHVHFFGTATISFADGIETRPGDVFEIEVPAFGWPLSNPLVRAVAETVEIKSL